MRWINQIADVKQEYFCTPAPFVISNHILVGVGGDSLDVPGYLEARDPETGRRAVALEHARRAPASPDAESWPDPRKPWSTAAA